ncbi:MAG: HIRAN domain-containing protein [Elusimicrobiota bacterium]|jgi:hypothetical protein|nr:HIRAN domain-containing protein [Elusimicrobiota bacterium]
MNEIVESKTSQLVKLINNKDKQIDMPKPFERDIFLFETYAAGTGYVENIEEIETSLKIDDKLSFFREPKNPHDSKAIVIKNAAGAKIGYVPKSDNEIFARLMDAGKLLFARVKSKELNGNWLNLEIKVYLRE